MKYQNIDMWDLPARTLTVYNFFLNWSIKVKAAERLTLIKIYLETIWYDISLLTELAVAMAIMFWQTYFDLEFSCF